MKKILLISAVVLLVGCSHFKKGGYTEQEVKQAVSNAASSQETKLEKTYKITQEKGVYYIVREGASVSTPTSGTPATIAQSPGVSTGGATGVLSPNAKLKNEIMAQKAGTTVSTQTTGKAPGQAESVKIKFPKGTLLGGASSGQAKALAELTVDSHNTMIGEMDKLSKEVKMSESTVKNEVKENKAQLTVIDSRIAKLEKQEAAILQTLQTEGKGEITVFFPFGRSSLNKGSAEYKRLVTFADYLSRESKDRKVFLTVIGSSSALRSPAGKRDYNQKLSELRATFVKDTIDAYLVNFPHEFSKVEGIGDSESPKTKDRTDNETHRSVRIIASIDVDRVSPSQGQSSSPASSASLPVSPVSPTLKKPEKLNLRQALPLPVKPAN